MYEFTTLGAIVGLVTGNMRNTIQITEFGLNNVIGISILLIGLTSTVLSIVWYLI